MPRPPCSFWLVNMIDESSDTKVGRRSLVSFCRAALFWRWGASWSPDHTAPQTPARQCAVQPPQPRDWKWLTCFCTPQALRRHGPALGPAASGHPSLGPSAQDRRAARWAGAPRHCLADRTEVCLGPGPHPATPGPWAQLLCAQPGSCPQRACPLLSPSAGTWRPAAPPQCPTTLSAGLRHAGDGKTSPHVCPTPLGPGGGWRPFLRRGPDPEVTPLSVRLCGSDSWLRGGRRR